MKTEIYYFSGSGNSLAVSKDIARNTKGKLIPITSTLNQGEVSPGADSIGIIFPVYHGDVPLIVKKFAGKLTNLEDKYLFAVCTYGDNPGPALKYLSKIIKSAGGKLSAGFAVNMPYNYITPASFDLKTFTLREIPEEKQRKLFALWKDKLAGVCEIIQAKKENKLETNMETVVSIIDFLGIKDNIGKYLWLKIAGYNEKTVLPFQESIRFMDHGFHSIDKCDGCGICSNICPVKDIKMINKRPSWQHRCVQCFACLQWCPKEAIQFGEKSAGKKRYHHPDIRITDMLLK